MMLLRHRSGHELEEGVEVRVTIAVEIGWEAEVQLHLEGNGRLSADEAWKVPVRDLKRRVSIGFIDHR